MLQWQRPPPDATLPQSAKPLEDQARQMLERVNADEHAVLCILYTGRQYPVGGANPENEAKRLQFTLTLLRSWSVAVLVYGPRGMMLLEQPYERMRRIVEQRSRMAARLLDPLSHDFDSLQLIVGRYGQGGFQGFIRAKDRRAGGNVIVKDSDGFRHPPFVIDPARIRPRQVDRIYTTGELPITVWRDQPITTSEEEP